MRDYEWMASSCRMYGEGMGSEAVIFRWSLAPRNAGNEECNIFECKNSHATKEISQAISKSMGIMFTVILPFWFVYE